MGRGRDEGRPVEPGEARAYGNDPDAVEVRRRGSSNRGDASGAYEAHRPGEHPAGIGLVDVGPGSQGGGGWVPALVGLIAFFTGGAVAGMTSAIRGPGSGLLNGFMVWALGTVLILLLSALGLGQLFGALGNVAGQVNPGALGDAAQSARGAAPNVTPQEAESAIRTGAIGAFFGLLFSVLASMLGGLLGARGSDPVGRPTDVGAER